MRKANPELVHGHLARKALEKAKGVRNAAYSQYIILVYHQTGSLDCGCTNWDLQAWYNANAEEVKEIVR